MTAYYYIGVTVSSIILFRLNAKVFRGKELLRRSNEVWFTSERKVIALKQNTIAWERKVISRERNIIVKEHKTKA